MYIQISHYSLYIICCSDISTTNMPYQQKIASSLKNIDILLNFIYNFFIKIFYYVKQ